MLIRFLPVLLFIALLFITCADAQVEDKFTNELPPADSVYTLAGYDVSSWQLTTNDLYAPPQKMTKHHVLGLAAVYCDPVLIAQALADGADHNMITVERLPIMEAALCPDSAVAVLSAMLDAGIDVNAVDYNNENVLSYAIYGGNTEAVEFLLERGADPLQRDTIEGFGCPPIFSVNTPEMLAFLLDNGFTLDQGCVSGRTLLHSAAENDNAELISYILENKLVTPTAIDVNEMTAWDYATENSASAAQDLLRDYR